MQAIKAAHIGFTVAAIAGAVLGVLVGYFASGDGISLSVWLAYRDSVWLWAIGGAAMGSALRYLSVTR